MIANNSSSYDYSIISVAIMIRVDIIVFLFYELLYRLFV
jgi:hypothetical protein